MMNAFGFFFSQGGYQMSDSKHDDGLKQYLIEEFIEDYQLGQMSRRDALKRLTGLVGASAAAALIAACAPVAMPTTSPAATAVPATSVPPTAMPPTAAPATAVPATAAATAAATDAPAATATGPSADPTLTTDATTPVTGAMNNVPVSADDPAIEASDITFPSGSDQIMGYIARPSADGTYPAILVSHENRGLTDHIKDVTRRLAKAGYVALAVDLLSRQGGTAAVGAENVPGVLGNNSPDQMVGDFIAGLEYLKTQPDVAEGQYGMTGFCFGGGMTWRVATKVPELRAAVPYYGPNPPLEDVPNIQAAVLAHYGGNDQRINAGIPDIEAAMEQNGKTFEYIIHEGANHAFNNDTGQNYNAQAANEAWNQTLEWFQEHLSG
jgi:carboxymethylenebutenolidase